MQYRQDIEGMESSRHLPRLEAASRQFFSWLSLSAASQKHGLASVLPRSRPYCLGLELSASASALPRLDLAASTSASASTKLP